MQTACLNIRTLVIGQLYNIILYYYEESIFKEQNFKKVFVT